MNTIWMALLKMEKYCIEPDRPRITL